MSAELSRRLAAAGYEFPATPPLAEGVLDRLPPAPERRRRTGRLAIAVALALCAALLASSGRARSAVVDVLDLVPGVEISRGVDLPREAALLAPLSDFGRPVSLEAARRSAGVPLRLPNGLREPDRVFLDRGGGGAAVTAVWGGEGGLASLVYTQWHPARLLFRKLLLSPDTRVDAVEVDGTRGLWIRGEEHEVFYVGMDGRDRRAPPVLAGRVLVWERDGVVYRLEGDFALREARRLARLSPR